mmetsp:Transcript_32807/g.64103  ORF Transcript_32807/g.64103 Transcript_32807/m.64103 type:complete len:294 (-) Transcript_32807:30-911(-)
MREELVGHVVVRVLDALDVVLVDPDRHPQEQALRALDHLAVEAQQVGLLEGLEGKVVEGVVTAEVDARVQLLGVRRHDGRHVVSDLGALDARVLVLVPVQGLDDLGELAGRVLVQCRHGDPARQQRVVGVLCREVRRGLGGQEVELLGPDLVVGPVDDLLRDHVDVDVSRVEPVHQRLHPHLELEGLDRLHSPVPLGHPQHLAAPHRITILDGWHLASTREGAEVGPGPVARHSLKGAVHVCRLSRPSRGQPRVFAVAGGVRRGEHPSGGPRRPCPHDIYSRRVVSRRATLWV